MSSYSEPAKWSDRRDAWREVMPGVKRRILTHSSTGMMVMYHIEPRRVFPLHSHPHAQYGVFLEGGGSFRVGGKEWAMKKGDAYFIPPGVPHELRTGDEPSVIIDFFTPAREDYVPEAPAPDEG
jgi:quercetin dioxygenase-like cupin family protein